MQDAPTFEKECPLCQLKQVFDALKTEQEKQEWLAMISKQLTSFDHRTHVLYVPAQQKI